MSDPSRPSRRRSPSPRAPRVRPPSTGRLRRGWRTSLAATSFLTALTAVVLAATGCGGPSGTATSTVKGTVTDFYGNPIPGINVYLEGHATTTAADGSFEADGVHAPYDVIVSFPTYQFVMVYQGLTRVDPTLPIYDGNLAAYTTSMSGTVGTTARASDEGGLLVPAGSGLADGVVQLASGGGPSFGPASVSWAGSATRPTTLYALTAHLDSNSLPTSYTGFGSLSLDLQDATPASGLTVPLNSVATASMDGTFAVPAGYTLGNAGVLLRLGNADSGAMIGVPAANLTIGGSSTGNHVPVLSGTIAYGLAAAADDGAGSDAFAWTPVPGPGTTSTLTVPPASEPVEPADNATGIAAGATFTWTKVPDALYVAWLEPGSSSYPTVLVVTTKTSITLPDLSVVNRPLPSNVDYGYSVLASGPFASIDEAMGPTGAWTRSYAVYALLSFSSPAVTGPVDDHGTVFYTQSPYRTFTTAP